jgi:hypothetical protein
MTDQLQRDPQDWKTGDEPMTEAQSSYLRTLSEESGEPFNEGLTKAQASERIDELQGRSPRLNESEQGSGSGQSNEPGQPNLDQELGADDVEDLSGDSPPGQNSDWMPQ